MSKINTPVLLIAFNRPNTTQKVFDEIKKNKPSKFYFAVDAPRNGNISDEINCKLVQEIANQVDWECEFHKRFSNINQGCGPGPYNAITWAFENEDRLIILEDDCVPAQSFFNYCDELLEKYKNDTRIWLISGNQFNEEAVKTNHSYFFSKYGHTWGWATWKRCWEQMDLKMSNYPLIIEQDLFKSAFRTKKEARFFEKIYNEIYYDRTSMSHIWDFQFAFYLLSNNHLSIVPSKNLVKNIGYLGTHSEIKNKFHDRPIDGNYKISLHPDFILCDIDYDDYHFKNHWNKKAPFLLRVIAKIKKVYKKWTKK